MIKAPHTYPFPITLMADFDAALTDDCTTLQLSFNGLSRSLSLAPCAPHQLADLATPFAAGDVNFERVNAVPGLPAGEYLALKVGNELLAVAAV